VKCCQGSEEQGGEDEAAKESDVEEWDGSFHVLSREFWAGGIGFDADSRDVLKRSEAIVSFHGMAKLSYLKFTCREVRVHTIQ
jgi:hypothetical protein